MIATVLVTALAAIQQAPLGVTGLRVEYLTNPLGIDATKPRLSWRITSGERIVMECCGVGRAEARAAIERAQGSVMLAIVMVRKGVDLAEARRLLVGDPPAVKS